MARKKKTTAADVERLLIAELIECLQGIKVGLCILKTFGSNYPEYKHNKAMVKELIEEAKVYFKLLKQKEQQ